MKSTEAAFSSVPPAGGEGAWFLTTHWSVVLAAREKASPAGQQALERLCQAYWYPLYAYVRRQGQDQESAKDLTQGFFARLLEKNYLKHVRPQRGKFRYFLLGSLKHFLSDEWDKAHTRKRGGGQTFVSLDAATAEERYRLEPVDLMDAEKLFERRWALTILDQARQRLREEYLQAGEAAFYERLIMFAAPERDALSYAQVAAEFGFSESKVKSAVFRMRQRHRELVRAEVAHTVGTSAEVDEEISYLISILSR